MNAMPLYQNGGFDYPVAMALATVLGLGFGFALERAGFGRASNLTAQFYGRDNRVFKVMFSAIVTAAIGMAVLAGVGVLDLSLLKIPETVLVPAVVGGLLLGVGFVVSGFCPGTAVVGSASGSVDAMVSLVGVMAGALVFGFAWPAVEGVYGAGNEGVLTFPDLLGVPWAVVAIGALVLAVGAFFGAEAMERWFAKRDHAEAPDAVPATRNRVFGGLAFFAVLGLATLALPVSDGGVAPAWAGDPAPAAGRIDAVTLAQQLVERPRSHWVVDLRAPSDCAAARVPGALCLSAEDPRGNFIAELPPSRPLVLYSAEGDVALPAAASSFSGQVLVVTGGWAAFERDVLSAPAMPENATPEAVARFQLRSALHGHYTGSKQAAPPVRARPKAVERKARKGGGC